MKQVDGSQYRILAVDDSSFILRLVENALESADFQVTTAISGEEGLEKIKRYGLPHLAIVDINMPMGMDGFEFCEHILEFCDLPIIMLTAINEEDTIVSAIEQYAEDYMTKPFNAGELVARVRRVLRRVGDFAYTLDPLTKVDDRLQVDFAGQRAVIEGEDVSLTPTETKLLYILMRNAGRTVTTDFILRRLWPLEAAYEDRLRVYVHRLRRKIEAGHAEPKYILSERGTGYTFFSGKNKAA
jgi:DNA-binding response OmpR family regulator